MEDNEFNRGKYANHFFEYSRAGIPGIYSNVEPYAGFIKDGKNGILCENTADGWIHAFERMMNVDTRRRISREAQDELKNKYSMKAVYSDLCRDLPELHTYHNDRGVSRFSLAAARMVCFFYEKLFARLVWLTHVILNGTFWGMLARYLKRKLRKMLTLFKDKK